MICRKIAQYSLIKLFREKIFLCFRCIVYFRRWKFANKNPGHLLLSYILPGICEVS